MILRIHYYFDVCSVRHRTFSFKMINTFRFLFIVFWLELIIRGKHVKNDELNWGRRKSKQAGNDKED